MANYSPQSFFRKTSNPLLEQYFANKGLLIRPSELTNSIDGHVKDNTLFDWESITETKIEPLYEAWLRLSDVQRNEITRDFQDVAGLANAAGIRAILDESQFWDDDLTEDFAKLQSMYDKSLWALMNKPEFWRGALAKHHVDSIANSYWKTLNNFPNIVALTDDDSITTLRKAIGNYFLKNQGRGENCHVDCYLWNDKNYFFVYPEDYARASIEWENKQFTRRPSTPAFEIIFIYSQDEHTLNFYGKGISNKKEVTALQNIFANCILKCALPKEDPKKPVYDLSPLDSRQFAFTFAPQSGIEKVVVKKLRLAISGTKTKITLDTNDIGNDKAVYDLLWEQRALI